MQRLLAGGMYVCMYTTCSVFIVSYKRVCNIEVWLAAGRFYMIMLMVIMMMFVHVMIRPTSTQCAV